jgi:DNA-binding winged helix-turn-helix (wHTH) protein
MNGSDLNGSARRQAEVRSASAPSLDVGAQRLTHGDEVHLLDPKAMGVLLHLAEAAPDYVSFEALLARTCRGRVGDNALYQVITACADASRRSAQTCGHRDDF